MNIDKLIEIKKHEISHSWYKFGFENVGEDKWESLFSKIGKQLDDLEVKMSDVTKVTFEGYEITLDTINVWVIDKKGKLEKIS